jgi:hypothetical protein
MSDFWNKNTKQLVIAAHDPNYQSNDWILVNKNALPNCNPLFWKEDNGQVVEMSTEEKDIILESLKRFRTKDEIYSLLNIVFNTPESLDKILDALDAVPSFDAALDKGNIPVALRRLLKAKTDGYLTNDEYSTIKTIIETKV